MKYLQSGDRQMKICGTFTNCVYVLLQGADMKFWISLFCSLLLASTIATSQTWEPAARIWDVEIIPLIVQVPGGPPLVQIRGMQGRPKILGSGT
ncbi:MAG: hypothetical protein HQ472_11020 [Ignavibacteria bacterium]|nr:hypothetical protein [Ignavibacteria bacterium]